ncbi:GNAT family N-acetyltransferase [Methylocystis sp.]|uniref:bifunctional acetate--CoA ligase family protein/GNAT family N-acetyltransferase n=1 Tax=Methylocystis sp. TaxID=1911079 RepID=UPI003DA20860
MTNQTAAPADVLLADGTIATISRLVPSDAPEVLSLHESVSDDASRLRFFTVSRRAGAAYASHLTAIDNDLGLAFVARRHGQLVGVASAEVDGSTAEIAFLVADDAHGLGIGTLLLEHLAAAARDAGIRTFRAEVLVENHPMIDVLADAGYAATKQFRGTAVTWEISTSPTAAVLDAADGRERVSEARSLGPLLAPRNVAVVGVRRDGQGIGNAVLRSIQNGGFTGTTYLVHPDAETLGDLPAHRSIRQIPERVDVAIVAVPASRVLDAVRDAAEAGVGATVIVTSGFGELGADGRQLENQVLQIAREHDMRIVGPNCLGLLCNGTDVRLNATFSSAVPPSGGLAIASQSGGVGIALLDLARELEIGVQSFVSLGNQADVTSADLMAAWCDDPAVTAAALYLESLDKPAKFARLARRFSEQKPLLAVVGGRSAGGARAGASHTASAATSAAGVQALFARSGVIQCHGVDELAHAARFLTEQKVPAGNKIAIVSNAGGIGILAADTADDLGMVVPELSEALQARIREHVTGTIGIGNPVDLGAAARPGNAAQVVELLLASGEVDALVVAVVATSVSDPTELVAAVAQARAAAPQTPVALVTMGGIDLSGTDVAQLTTFSSLDDSLQALDHAVRYGEWLRSPRPVFDEFDDDRMNRARQVAGVLTGRSTATEQWLAPGDQQALLGPYGVSLVGEVATGAEEAAAAAERLGFPVAVKVADPAVVHKTDRGLVQVGLTSAEAVADAVNDFQQTLETPEAPVLVQPMVAGVELAIGLVRHPTFGPLVMVAAGGVATDVLDDRRFLMPPITQPDAAHALRGLRIWPLLNGYRGSSSVDLEALEHLVVAVGQLACEIPEIAELDLNPVMANAAGAAVVDIKVRLRPTDESSGPDPRQLGAQPPA